MSAWAETTLQNVVSVLGDGLHGTPEYNVDGEYYFINGNNLKNGKIVIKPDTKRCLEEEYEKYKKPLNNRTILVSINGTIGNVAVYKGEKCFLGKSACYFNVKEDVCKEYIKYVVTDKSFQSFLEYNATGTTIINVSLKLMREYTLKLPPLPEQKAIASVLSSLDDKIDLLHRQNNTLEAMVETLFRQWFVVEAEEDWGQGTLPDEFDFTMGQSPPGSSFNEEYFGTPMFQGNADFGFRFPKDRIYTNDPKRFAEQYETLISVRAPVGAQNMALKHCCIGRGVAVFRYKNNNVFYTYTYFKLRSLMKEIKEFNQTGTVFGSISKTDFENLKIIIPPKIIVDKFQREVKPIDDKIISNSSQIHNLQKLRDTLLPKLMSGEVQVEVFPLPSTTEDYSVVQLKGKKT